MLIYRRQLACAHAGVIVALFERVTSTRSQLQQNPNSSAVIIVLHSATCQERTSYEQAVEKLTCLRVPCAATNGAVAELEEKAASAHEIFWEQRAALEQQLKCVAAEIEERANCAREEQRLLGDQQQPKLLCIAKRCQLHPDVQKDRRERRRNWLDRACKHKAQQRQ